MRERSWHSAALFLELRTPFPPSHLVGLFYRTIRMIDNGIKPVFVFDGKPMALKTEEVRMGTWRLILGRMISPFRASLGTDCET